MEPMGNMMGAMGSMMGAMGSMWGSGMGWWMLWSGLLALLFWGTILGLVVWAVKQVTREREPRRADPTEIARERLARGEIAGEQYEQILQTLSAR